MHRGARQGMAETVSELVRTTEKFGLRAGLADVVQYSAWMWFSDRFIFHVVHAGGCCSCRRPSRNSDCLQTSLDFR